MMRWIAIIGITLGSGCTSQLEVLTEETNVIQVSDFSNSIAVDSVVIDLPNGELLEQTDEEREEVELEESVVVEAPTIEEEENEFMPQTVGVAITVEALVGQVNGRPVYANRVLAPLIDRLQAGSRKVNSGDLTITQFKDLIRDLLYVEYENMGVTVRGGRVYRLVITDLLLSEARSNMSKEQAHGVFALIGQMRDDLASAQGGSHSQLRESIKEDTGSTVDEFLDLQRDEILIDALQRQKIWPKVNVTWRDIQREFDKLSLNKSIPTQKIDQARLDEILINMQNGTPLRDISAANGSITLGKIRLPIDDPQIEIVNDGFAMGLSFEEVARSVQVLDDGVWGKFPLGKEGLNGIDVADFFIEKLQGVKEGDVIPPFEFGSGYFWIAVLEIKEPVSLYNRPIQIALRNVLRWIQFNKEKIRFVEMLWGKGSIEEVKSMAERIKDIANRRYLQ